MNVRKEGKKTMEKVSMNKLEMARRAAKGGSGGTIQPATSEKLGGVKIGEGINVSEDGTISVPSYVPPAYSTNEVATGRKWIDGKDIYEKIINYNGALSNTATTLATGIDYMSNIIDAACIADNGTEGISPITLWIDGTDLKGRTVGNFSSQLLHIVIQYTKAGA